MTYPNTPEYAEKRRIKNVLYYLRHKEERMADHRRRAMFPEQVIYRVLYSRYRFAVKGRKLNSNEQFNKPSKQDRLNLYELKKEGCTKCYSKDNLELDHIDGYPNNNNLTNLQWLCKCCHMKKTRTSRQKESIAEKYKEIAKMPKYTKYVE